MQIPNLRFTRTLIYSFTYFKVLFAFINANLHDNGVIVFAHVADPDVSRSIHNWVYTQKFYIVED